MLNAIVSTKDNSTVIEFPIDLYELYRQLNQNGVTQGPHRINIVDDENADVRVKLYSDSEFGKHIIRLMSEKDTLEDLHTVVGAINNAPDEVMIVIAPASLVSSLPSSASCSLSNTHANDNLQRAEKL